MALSKSTPVKIGRKGGGLNLKTDYKGPRKAGGGKTV